MKKAMLVAALCLAGSAQAEVCEGEIEQYAHGLPRSVMVVYDETEEGPIKIHCSFDTRTPVGKQIMQACGEHRCRIEGVFRREGEMVEPVKVQAKRVERTHMCRGLLTSNWTEGVADNAPAGGSLLIRADKINNSCLFEKGSEAGKKILAACRMGYPCEVRARLSDEPADVHIISGVLSARSLQ
jgi:hypothetical protein